MGSFIFTWKHPASEVYVTGTFDNWSKSERLDLTGDVFSKNVLLPSASEKIYYKFVVDGNWVTDHTAPQENDDSGNLNNILTPDRINKFTPESLGIMSGVTPNSTTASLVGAIPLEKNKTCGSVSLPGTFPETPAPGEETTQPKILASKVSLENNNRKVKEDLDLPFPSLSLTRNAQNTTDPTVPSLTGLIPDPSSNSESSQATLFTDSIIQTVGPQSSSAALVGEIPKILSKQKEQNSKDNAGHASNDLHTRIVEPEKNAVDDSTIDYIKPEATGTEPSQVQGPAAHIPLPDSHELLTVSNLSGPVSEQHPTPDLVNDRQRDEESQNKLTEMAKDISNDMKIGNIKPEQDSKENCCKAPENNFDGEVISRDFCPVNKFEVSSEVSTSTAEPFTASLPVSPHMAQPAPGSITEQTTRLSIPDDDIAASSSNSPTITDKTDKKKKRTSFFGKLKAKLIYKDKD